MKEQSIYIADDSTRFDSEIECMKYEVMCKEIELIAKPLGIKPDDCDFANGGGYIQHNNPNLVKIELAKYLYAKDPKIKAAKQIIDGEDINMSWVGWYIDGMGRCVNNLISRLSCINYISNREYGQPYFVSHENEAKQIKLNQ